MTDTTTIETADQPLLALARDAMDLAPLDAALTAVQSRQAAAGALATSESDLINAVAVEIGASLAIIPEDLGQRIIAQRRVNEEAHAEIEALRRIQEQLETAERDRHRDRADAGLAVLAAELDDIIDAARAALADLGDIDSADTAITYGRADEWHHARALAERHGELRTGQKIVLSAAVTPARQGRIADDVTPEAAVLVDLFGTVRNPARYTDVAAHAKIAAQGPNAQHWTPGLISGQPVAVNQSPPPPWLDTDPIKVLRFVTRPYVQAWVPTVTELRAAQNEVTRRKSPDNEERQPVTSAEIAVAWKERGERSLRERGLIGGRHV